MNPTLLISVHLYVEFSRIKHITAEFFCFISKSFSVHAILLEGVVTLLALQIPVMWFS